MIRARNKLQLFTWNLFTFKNIFFKKQSIQCLLFRFVSFFIVFHRCLIGFIVSFVCASFFLSLFIAMNVILFWFSILFIYVIGEQHSKLWSSILERKNCPFVSVSSQSALFVALSKDTETRKHTHTRSFTCTCTHHRPHTFVMLSFTYYVFQFLHFHFIRSMCRSLFYLIVAHVSLWRTCVIFIFHIFFRSFHLKKSQYNFHSIHSYTLNMYAQIERKSLLFWYFWHTFMAR